MKKGENKVPEMVSKVGAKDFKLRVKNKLRQINSEINDEDLYFSQILSGYYLEYRPAYPNESPADFIVYQDLNGSISVYGNLQAIVPTIEKYEDIEDFENRL